MHSISHGDWRPPTLRDSTRLGAGCRDLCRPGLSADPSEPKLMTGRSDVMVQELTHYATKRRFPRARGPFDGYQGSPQTPVLIYDLNVGGGFVNFGGTDPTDVDFELTVAL